MQTLEELCRPILMTVCDYWQYIDAGFEPDREKFRCIVLGLLADAKEQAAKVPSLEREFMRMERPLVFFIDYMVKEGNFTFRNEWRELARNYNELSGDEKFFDMLTDALDDPDTGGCLEVFYNMIGLGFCGIYQNNPEYIERRMKVCASRFANGKLDVGVDEITPLDYSIKKKNVLPKIKKIKRIKTWLLVSFIIMLGSFVYNLTMFAHATYDYRKTLEITSKESIPKALKDIQIRDAKKYDSEDYDSLSDKERVRMHDTSNSFNRIQDLFNEHEVRVEERNEDETEENDEE